MIALWCAWCGAFMRSGTLPASHGICDKCNALHFPSEVS